VYEALWSLLENVNDESTASSDIFVVEKLHKYCFFIDVSFLPSLCVIVSEFCRFIYCSYNSAEAVKIVYFT
jgi:hypothetical protein